LRIALATSDPGDGGRGIVWMIRASASAGGSPAIAAKFAAAIT